jgi:hypothetical protein
MAHGAEPGADPAGPASHTINTLRGSIGTHLQPGEWKAIENALEGYGNMTAKKAKAPLLAALKNARARLGSIMDCGVPGAAFELAMTGQDDAQAAIEAAS